MEPASLSAKEIADRLWQVVVRCRHQCSEAELDAIEEAIRRLKQHELLVRDVLPDLRRRLAEPQGAPRL